MAQVAIYLEDQLAERLDKVAKASSLWRKPSQSIPSLPWRTDPWP